MPRKINKKVNASGTAAVVADATSMSDGKTYVRNPQNPSQVLQIQSKEGNVYKCFAVTSKNSGTINVDSTKAVYVSEDAELFTERL